MNLFSIPMPSAIRHQLRLLLQGPAVLVGERMRAVFERLSVPEHAMPGAFELSGDKQRLAAVAFKVDRVVNNQARQALVDTLLNGLPNGAEVYMVTHAAPMQPPARASDSHPMLHFLDAPLEGALEVSGYLFLRAACPSEHLHHAGTDALRSAGIAYHGMSFDEVQKLLMPWSQFKETKAQLRSLDAKVSSVIGFVARSFTYFCHPQGSEAAAGLRDLATWEAVSFRVCATPLENFAVAAHATLLLQGPRETVERAMPNYFAAYAHAGLALQELAFNEDRLRTLPWLTTTKARTPSGETRAPQWKVPLSNLVPFAQGARFNRSSNHPALLARDQQGSVCPLLHAEDLNMGGNVLVQGCAGSGLTYFSNAMLSAHLVGGGSAWSLRWSRDRFFEDAHATEGVWLELAKPLSINPLHGFTTPDAFEDAKDYLTPWLQALSGRDLRETSDYERHTGRYAIEQALTSAWSLERENLGLGAVLARLEAQGELGTAVCGALRTRLGALSPAWFEGPPSFDRNAKYVSFGFADNHPAEELGWTVLTLYALTIKSRPGMEPKMLVVDEAALLGQDGAPSLIARVLRGLRPRNGRAVIVDHTYRTENRWPHETAFIEACGSVALLYSACPEESNWSRYFEDKQEFANVVKSARNFRTHAHIAWISLHTPTAQLVELRHPPAARVVLGGAPPFAWAAYKGARESGKSALEAAGLAAQVPHPSRQQPAAANADRA